MRTSPRRRAFTLLELIVSLVVLAVLAAIAVPTFAAVIDRSRDAAAQTTLAAAHREAWALAALDQGAGYELSHFSVASAAAPGVLAAAPLEATFGPSTRHAELSVGIDAAAPTRVGLAMRSESGHCVLLLGESGRVVSTRIDETLSGALECTGGVAFSAAGTSGSVLTVAPAPAIPSVPSWSVGDREVVLKVQKPYSYGYGQMAYRVYDGNSTTPLTSIFDPATGSLRVTGLTNSTSYQLQVEAVSTSGSARLTTLPWIAPAKVVVIHDACASRTTCSTVPALLAAQGYTSVTYDTSVDSLAELQSGGYSMVIAASQAWSFTVSAGQFLDTAHKAGYDALSFGNDNGADRMPLYATSVSVDAAWGLTPVGSSPAAQFVGGPTARDTGVVATSLRSDVQTFATWNFGGYERPVGVSVGDASTARWANLQITVMSTTGPDMAAFRASLRWVTTGR